MNLTNFEAIQTIKSNYPPDNYKMLQKALDMAIDLLGKTNEELIESKSTYDLIELKKLIESELKRRYQS